MNEFERAAALPFRVGHVWCCRTQDDEENAYISLLRVTTGTDGRTLMHASLSTLRIERKAEPAAVLTAGEPRPVDDQRLRSSLTQIIEITKQVPDVQAWLTAWRSTYDRRQSSLYASPGRRRQPRAARLRGRPS